MPGSLEDTFAQRVTKLLQAARGGDAEAFDEALRLVYSELRRLARGVRQGRASETISTVALAHEAYLKLLPSADTSWNDRVHFLRVSARAMRQMLVSAALRRQALKRGSGILSVTSDEQKHQQPPEQLQSDGAEWKLFSTRLWPTCPRRGMRFSIRRVTT